MYSAEVARNRVRCRLCFGTGFSQPTLLGGAGGASLSTVYVRGRLGFSAGFVPMAVALLSRSSLVSEGVSARLARDRARCRFGFGTGFAPSALVVGSGEASFSTVYEWGRLSFGTGFLLISVALLSRASPTS